MIADAKNYLKKNRDQFSEQGKIENRFWLDKVCTNLSLKAVQQMKMLTKDYFNCAIDAWFWRSVKQTASQGSIVRVWFF